MAGACHALYLRALPNHLHPGLLHPSKLHSNAITSANSRRPTVEKTPLATVPHHTLSLVGSFSFGMAFCSHDCSHCALPESRDCPALTDPALSDAPYTLWGRSVTKCLLMPPRPVTSSARGRCLGKVSKPCSHGPSTHKCQVDISTRTRNTRSKGRAFCTR